MHRKWWTTCAVPWKQRSMYVWWSQVRLWLLRWCPTHIRYAKHILSPFHGFQLCKVLSLLTKSMIDWQMATVSSKSTMTSCVLKDMGHKSSELETLLVWFLKRQGLCFHEKNCFWRSLKGTNCCRWADCTQAVVAAPGSLCLQSPKWRGWGTRTTVSSRPAWAT